MLDKEDPSAVSPAMWNHEESATLFINALYEKSMPQQGFGANSQNSDEASGNGENDAVYGRVEVKTITD